MIHCALCMNLALSGSYLCATCRAERKKEILKERKQAIDAVNFFHERADIYAKKIGMDPPKCISDKILLYLRYGISCIDTHTKDKREELERYATKLYERIRGEPRYTSKNPRAIAATISYLACVKLGISVPQLKVCDIFEISDPTIRANYKRMKRDLRL